MQTVVAVFDDYSTAQQAARDLFEEGVSPDAVHVESNLRTGAAGYSGSDDPANREQHEGGFTGWLHRLFGSHDDGSDYAEAIRRGGAVLTASVAESQVDKVSHIMDRDGAVDIDTRVQSWRQSGYSGYDPEAQPYTYDEAVSERAPQAGTAVPVIEEELQVGKRVVQRGGVRVYSRVVNQPVEEKISLREEHVRVERRPVDRPVDASDMSGLRDRTIEVTEMAEEPVVSKRARVKEEVVVGKEATERTETIKDNVRRTEVQVDELAEPSRGQSSGDASYDYGYRAAGDARYSGRSWADAETDVRSAYLRDNPTTRWDDVKDKVRSGWEKVTGRR